MYKKKLGILFGSFTFFCGIMVLVSFVGDAGCLFYRKNLCLKAAKILVSGKNLTNIVGLNERLLQVYLAENLTENVGTLALGSSRTMGISRKIYSDMFFINGSVSGATVEDLMAIFALYSKEHQIRRVVIGVDPWIFNLNNGMTRWKQISQYYFDFIGKTSGENMKGVFISELFSFDYFKKSLNQLMHRKPLLIVPDTLVLEQENDILMSDASRVYGEKTRDISLPEKNKKAYAYAVSDPMYALGDFEKIDKSKKEEFDFFLEKLKNMGIEIFFWLPPYHPIVYDTMYKDKRYHVVFLVEDYIRKIAALQGISVIGSYNPEEAGVTEEYFLDGMHLDYKGYLKIWGVGEKLQEPSNIFSLITQTGNTLP